MVKAYSRGPGRGSHGWPGGCPLAPTDLAFLLLMNPPARTRLRGLASKAFSVRQAAELRALTQTNADALLDE